MKAEKLSILNLTKYYANRYNLDRRCSSDAVDGSGDGLGSYNKKISRLIEDTMVAGVSLWQIIKPDKGIRQISVEDFEMYCFEQWEKYIIENCESYSISALAKDRKKYNKLKESKYRLLKKRSRLQAEIDEYRVASAQNDPYVNADYVKVDDNDIEYVDDFFEQLEKEKHKEAIPLGYNMMIEALFELFYEPFNWERLKFDKYNAVLEDGWIMDDNVISLENLEDYKNYVKKKE